MTRIAYRRDVIPLLVLLLSLLWSWVPSTRAAEPGFERILFLASEDNRPHQRIFSQFQDLGHGQMIYAPLDDPSAEAWLETWDCSRCLVITSGSRALDRALSYLSKAHILSITIPRQAFEQAIHVHGDTERLAAIFMDIPLERRIAITRDVIPDLQRLAVVEGPDCPTATVESENHETEGATELKRFVTHRENDLVRTFSRASDQADAVLTIPDRRVYNPRTIVSIVMTTYRHRTPLIAHSESLLRAGALISIHATPEQLGAEAAHLLRNLQSGQIPWTSQRRHTAQHEVAFNPHVSRSLGIRVAP